MDTLVLSLLGICSGLMVSAGVFTVLFIVGLVPRFAGRTNTARCELLYEEVIIAGSITGGILSVFPIQGSVGELLITVLGNNNSQIELSMFFDAVLIFIGIFSGIFVGCLSIALAEVLDGIPIFERRVNLKKGLELIIFAVAFGKLAGSLVYFIMHFW